MDAWSPGAGAIACGTANAYRVRMRIAFAIFLAAHASLHAVGVAKAFGIAPFPQLSLPISRRMGIVWLGAGALVLASAVALFALPRWFWLFAIPGVAASQIAVVSSWKDARAGTLANAVTLAAALYGAFAWGPFGLRGEYERRTVAPVSAPARWVTESDLAPFPPSVQRYLRYVGVVGQPRIDSFRVRFTGRIRGGADAPWMAFTGEQRNVVDPSARMFFMSATMRGVPVYALHTYENNDARMRVKVLSLFPVVDASGVDFTRTETVTLLNDLCILAPAALVGRSIQWKEIDALSTEAIFTQGPNTVHATLLFDDSGALINFWSDDRPSLSDDGIHFVPQRWSTPVGNYRQHGPFRLASRGEGHYGVGANEYAYIQFDDLDVRYNDR